MPVIQIRAYESLVRIANELGSASEIASSLERIATALEVIASNIKKGE